MRGSDYFLIGLTFFTGVFAGVYVYVTGFAPAYVYDPLVKTGDITFELSGQMYGGCERATERCARFTIKEDRTYQYEPAQMRGTNAPTPTTGVLSRDTYEQLIAEVRRAPLKNLNTPASLCASASDGTDYRYRLVLDGEEYFFDSCGTTFGSSRLAGALSGMWLKVATSTSWVDSVSDFRPDAYIGDWLHERLRGE